MSNFPGTPPPGPGNQQGGQPPPYGQQPPYGQPPQQPYGPPQQFGAPPGGYPPGGYGPPPQRRPTSGIVLMFGLIGVVLFVVCNCMSSLGSSVVATALFSEETDTATSAFSTTDDTTTEISDAGAIFLLLVWGGTNLFVPTVIGYMAGGSAVNSGHAQNSADTARIGAMTSGFTAVIYTVFLVLCLVALLGSIEDTLNDSGLSLGDAVEGNEDAGAVTLLVCSGMLIFSILLYAGLGALGGALVGNRRNTPPPVQQPFGYGPGPGPGGQPPSYR